MVLCFRNGLWLLIKMLAEVVPVPVVKSFVGTHIKFLDNEESGTIITFTVLRGSSLRDLKEFYKQHQEKKVTGSTINVCWGWNTHMQISRNKTQQGWIWTQCRHSFIPWPWPTLASGQITPCLWETSAPGVLCLTSRFLPSSRDCPLVQRPLLFPGFWSELLTLPPYGPHFCHQV